MSIFNWTRRRWVNIALLLSLTLNLLFAGFMIGRASAPTGTATNPVLGFPHFARTLPPERRQELRPVVRGHLGEMRKPMRSLRQERHRVAKIVTTDPLDAEGLRAALEKMRQGENGLQQRAHDSFVEFVSQLTLEERIALIESGERRSRHRKGFGGPNRKEH